MPSYTNHTYRGVRPEPNEVRITVDGFIAFGGTVPGTFDWGYYGGAVRYLAQALSREEFPGLYDQLAVEDEIYKVLAKITADTWEFDSRYLRTLLDLTKFDQEKVRVHHFHEYDPPRVRLTLATYDVQVEERTLTLVGTALYNPADRALGVEGSRAGGREQAVVALKRLYTSFCSGLIEREVYPNAYFSTSNAIRDAIWVMREQEKCTKEIAYSNVAMVNNYRLAARGKLHQLAIW